MAPHGGLFQHLADLDKAASRERKLARQRLQQKQGGEILTTCMAFPLHEAQERLERGMAIGDAVELCHVHTNQNDANAIEVRWRQQVIGHIPRELAAVLVREMPDLESGVAAVITELATTTQRDAFRLQLSIPIERASRSLRALSLNASFSWDFNHARGDDKLRLVLRCSEKDLRDLQQVLAPIAETSKCGYTYYPLPDGRSFPWYLSLTAPEGGAPPDAGLVEAQIRQAFGVASESTLLAEREQRFETQRRRLEEISERLKESRQQEQRLQKDARKARADLEERRSSTLRRQEEGLRQAKAAELEREQLQQEVERLSDDLEVALKELDVAHSVAETARLEKAQIEEACGQIENDVIYLRSLISQRQGWQATGASEPDLPLPGGLGDDLQQRLLRRLRHDAARQSPREILELINELCPDSFVLLPSALSSAEEAEGFELGSRLFDLLWSLATHYRQLRLEGGPDVVAQQVFGHTAWAARESQTTLRNATGKAERTFAYKGDQVLMQQHLKIGVKDSPNHTLRLHFHWDPEDGVVVIGHCGPHLFVQGH